MAEDTRHCPGEKYTISEAVCRGRRGRHFPKCKGCAFNDDEVGKQASKSADLAPIPDGIFKAYDIRGKSPGEITDDVAWRIGFAAAQYLLATDDAQKLTGENARAVALGYDMRLTGESLSKACADGILAAGADCVVVGDIETPAIYYAVGSLNAAGGIMITASHNPAEYNGFKITAAGVKPVGENSGLPEIKSIAQALEQAGGPLKGKLRYMDISSGYILHVRKFIDPVRPMKIVMDASNGMSSKWTPSILREMNLDVTSLNFERSGRFTHNPNPLLDESLADLKQKVIETQARVGVCFDGDADRCVVVDENGERVGGDILTALLAREFLKKEHGASIIYDLRSSWVVREEIEKLGGVPRRERVGHSFMKAALRQFNAPLGGELSGHFYYRDNFFCDSAIITFVKVLAILSQTDAPFSEILEPLLRYHSTGEVNFHVEEKDQMITDLARKFSDGKVDFLDGVTVEYDQWWFNCRKSNTEPLLRLNVEARSKELLDEKYAKLKALLGEPVNE
jgi:phosphomannomutase